VADSALVGSVGYTTKRTLRAAALRDGLRGEVDDMRVCLCMER
jgi:hypothetical protein